ncbi:MAG: amidohydrolase family protein [Thermoplasmata archaeon]
MPPRRKDRVRRASPTVELPELVIAGRAFVRGKLQTLEVGIDADGWIVRLGKDLRGQERHEVGEAILIPSATDLHVHFREPGPSSGSETIRSGTTQAALGGTALVGEMPNTVPPVTHVEDVEDKAGLVRGRAAVDVLLYAALTPRTRVASVSRVAGAFKYYMSPTTGIDTVAEPSGLREQFDAIAASGLALSVHAESPRRFGPELSALDPVGWNETRPPISESEAVDELLQAVPSSLRLHVAHVTEASVAERLRDAGHSFEATPHHLLLSARSGTDARYKVNPPLRADRDRIALWEAFRAGNIPIVASDHAPHDLPAKSLPFPWSPSGMPGVGTMVPLLLAAVRRGDLELERLIAAACDRPARWLGAPHGRIAVGHRADLLVIDFRAVSEISARKMATPCGWTAFEGWKGIFPKEHFFHGRRIVDDGEYVGRHDGQVVRPEYAPGGRPVRGPASRADETPGTSH